MPSEPSLTQRERSDTPDPKSADCSQLCADIKWSQCEDFPSSEDLSAFLADLALDGDLTGDEERKVATANEQATALDCHNEIRSCALPVDKLQNYTELTDFPSSEDLEAFLADIGEDSLLGEIDTCLASYCPTTTAPATPLTSVFPLESSALEKNSFGCNGQKYDLSGEASKVVDGFDRVLSSAASLAEHSPSYGSVLDTKCQTDEYAVVGQTRVVSYSEAGGLSIENFCKESGSNSTSPSFDTQTRIKTNQINAVMIRRGTKRSRGNKPHSSTASRISVFRKLSQSGVDFDASPTLSPVKKNRRRVERCGNRIRETPEHDNFGAYSEKLFSGGVEDGSASQMCDAQKCCLERLALNRDLSDASACERISRVQPISLLDSPSICSNRKADNFVVAEKVQESCILSVRPEASCDSNSLSYFGTPELFSHSSSGLDAQDGTPNLFSQSETSHEYSISCEEELSGSILLFSSSSSYSPYLSSVCPPGKLQSSVSNIGCKSVVCHSTPLLKSDQTQATFTRHHSALFYPTRAGVRKSRSLLRSLKAVTPQSMLISGSVLAETPILFSQLSNSNLVGSIALDSPKYLTK